MKLKHAFLLLALLGLLIAPVMAQDGDMGMMSEPVVEPLDPPAQVSVAYVPIMKFAPLYVAAERGLFEKYGLDVEINSVASGTEAIAFLTEGQIDVGGIAIVTSLWNGWNEGLDIRIFAPGGLEPLQDSPTKLLVRRDLFDSGAVTEIADLEGRIVALAGGPGSGGEYLTTKALELGGLSLRDVQIERIGNPDMPAAFENGAIAAGLLGSPYADQAIDAGVAVAIAEDFVPGLMTVAFVGSGEFITERPEVALRFTLALTEAARLMQGDDYLAPENMAAYLAYVNSTEEAIRTGVPIIYDPNQVIPLDGLADVERVHRENGRTNYDTPINLENVTDTSFTEQAIELLGEYQAGEMGMGDMGHGGMDMGMGHGGGTSAAYMQITNNGTEAVTLTAGTASFANIVEIHETSVDENGVARMAQLEDGLTIAPGETVALRPGGLHVMFIGITNDLMMDETTTFTLIFADGATTDITAMITDTAPEMGETYTIGDVVIESVWVRPAAAGMDVHGDDMDDMGMGDDMQDDDMQDNDMDEMPDPAATEEASN